MGLMSVLQTRFGRPYMPPTFQRGSIPIDNIFVSPSISASRAGMLEFGNGPGDHRALFLDVCQESLIGLDSYKIHRQPVRRLISTNPVVIDRFNRDYDYQLSRNHIHEQMLKNMRKLIAFVFRHFTTPTKDATSYVWVPSLCLMKQLLQV